MADLTSFHLALLFHPLSPLRAKQVCGASGSLRENPGSSF